MGEDQNPAVRIAGAERFHGERDAVIPMARDEDPAAGRREAGLAEIAPATL